MKQPSDGDCCVVLYYAASSSDIPRDIGSTISSIKVTATRKIREGGLKVAGLERSTVIEAFHPKICIFGKYS